MAQMMTRQMYASRFSAECSSARISDLLDTAVVLVVSILVCLRLIVFGRA